MAIQTIDDKGNIIWKCPNIVEESTCGTSHAHHISHDEIQWHGLPGAKPQHRLVSLPPCPDCGGITFLKVYFTEKELRTPNMWIAWQGEHEAELQRLKVILAVPGPHDEEDATWLDNRIRQLEAAKAAGGMPTDSHAVAHRHMALAQQLIVSGKAPPSPLIV